MLSCQIYMSTYFFNSLLVIQHTPKKFYFQCVLPRLHHIFLTSSRTYKSKFMKIHLQYIGRLNDPKWQFNVEWSDFNFDIYENYIELSHLYVDMSKFMAHGTVTFTCYNHKIGVVILHKVYIWQVVEELHYNIQIACLKQLQSTLVAQSLPKGLCNSYNLYIQESLICETNVLIFYSALMYLI